MTDDRAPDLLSRYHGALLGLAAGDALGTTLEFTKPGEFTPISDMVGGGPFNLRAGEWTDDTSMALCLAESLLESNGFDPYDQLSRYVHWKRRGHHSSNGVCFDIGGTVMAALARFERFSEPYAGSTAPNSAGNGSIMRLAPVPLFFDGDPLGAIENAALSSKTTHGHPEAVDACRYFAGLMVGALEGRSRDELLQPHFTPVEGIWEREPLAPAIGHVSGGSFLRDEPPIIRGSGYVTRSLEAALWAFAKSTCFEDGALLAVNLGEDADTTGAVYGQIAGAYYGVGSIPERWRSKLAKLDVIDSFAPQLSFQSGTLSGNDSA
jgi:ADP-ribosyl-[dinitrogen reductase] hydrolase